MASTVHTPPPVGVHRHHSPKLVCFGILLASLAIAGIVVPMEWNLLAVLADLPKWSGLQQLLAVVPLASWLLMLVWGTAVPVSLLLALRYHRNATGAALALGFAALALLWYMHMPALNQCDNLYPNPSLCTGLQWSYSLSLAVANAVYLFAIIVGLLSGIGLIATKVDDGEKPGLWR
ncbi:MAG: hypothetical protein ACN6O3_10275 [Comamonas sp.]